MRVALVCFENPATFTGGVERHTVELARALNETGHDVRLITRAPDEGDPPEDPWGVETTWVPVPLARGPLPAYHHQRLMRPLFHRRLVDRLGDPDVVHSQDDAGLGALGHAPVVATVHTDVVGEYEAARKPLPQGLPQRLLVAWDRSRWRAWGDALDGSIAVSPATAANLREHFDMDPVVVPNGLPEREPVPREDARREVGVTAERHVVYLGRLAEVKRVDRLLEAAVHLDEDVAVTVGGDGPAREALEAKARSLGVDDTVRFAGYVPEEEKAALLASADAFALPSDHEGQPIVLLEAIQQRVPVVVSTADWLPERLHAHAIEAPPEGGAEALAAALADAMARGRLDDPAIPTWGDVARETAEVYEAALA